MQRLRLMGIILFTIWNVLPVTIGTNLALATFTNLQKLCLRAIPIYRLDGRKEQTRKDTAVMTNPNQSFKDREFTGQGLAKITIGQRIAIFHLIRNDGFNYDALLIEALHLAPFDMTIPIDDLTYEQAVKIIITANRDDLPDAIMVVDA